MLATILSTCYTSTESLGVSELNDTDVKSFGVLVRMSQAVESTNFTTIVFNLPHIMAPKSRTNYRQATGLDAWASMVKCPARFVSHLHEICIYIWVVYSLCFFCCLFITVTWWYVWCFERARGNQEEVQACLVTLWLFITSCYSLFKTTLCLLYSWFENNPHFHKYSMDFHV